jgi:hypothetical protein
VSAMSSLFVATCDISCVRKLCATVLCKSFDMERRETGQQKVNKEKLSET